MVVIVAGSGEKYWKVLVETFIFGPVGLLFGLLFGLGFAQLIGQIAGLDVLDSARLVGLGVGLRAGLLLGQGSGLLGGMAWQVLVTGLVWLGESNLVLIGWLAGLLVGTISGGAARMVTLAPSKLTFDQGILLPSLLPVVEQASSRGGSGGRPVPAGQRPGVAGAPPPSIRSTATTSAEELSGPCTSFLLG